MKKFFLIVFGVTTLFGLILAFQNISIISEVAILFSDDTRSLFMPMVLMFFLGFLAGFSLALSFVKGKSNDYGDSF